MVKRQKEKQYNSARENRAYSQLRSNNHSSSAGTVRKLPFNCCALSLTPYNHPVCNQDGIVFDNSSLLPFVLKHKVDPVSGKAMSTRDILTLQMDKDPETNQWQCPVLCKPFADHTKIVAIRQNPPGNTANVYSYEAYKELNIKAKNYEDLVSGLKFHKQKDVIILNDPNNDDFHTLRDINTFYHIKNSRELDSQKQKGNDSNVLHSVTSTRIMDKIQKKQQKDDQDKKHDKKRNQQAMSDNNGGDNHSSIPNDYYNYLRSNRKMLSSDVTGVQYTSGKTSSSFTSTSLELSYKSDSRIASQDEVYETLFLAIKKLKKKGYVKLETSLGDLLLELHCDVVPRTCTNFLELCETNQYTNSKFHRCIPNFMIQGGSGGKNKNHPTEVADNWKNNDTDDGNGSIWGGTFQDEFDDRLKHNKAGIVSMANAGPNTNQRQFFMTFKECPHLDKKHSVFGEIIKGTEEVLCQNMQTAPIDKKNRPLEDIIIRNTVVLANPIQEAKELEKKRIETNIRSRERKTQQEQQQPKKRNDDNITSLVKTNSNTKEENNKKAKTASSSANNNNKKESTMQIGRYLSRNTTSATTAPAYNDDDNNNLDFGLIIKSRNDKKPPPKKTTFGNFSGW